MRRLVTVALGAFIAGTLIAPAYAGPASDAIAALEGRVDALESRVAALEEAWTTPPSSATPSPAPSVAPSPAPTSTPTTAPTAAPTAAPTTTPPPTPTTSCPPVQSIQAAVNAAPSGATVCIPAGTYRETVTINKPLTLVGHGAVIDGDNVRQFAIRALAADVTIEGFEVTDHRPPYQRGAIESFMVARTVIRDVFVHDNPRPGAYATDVGGGISFSGGGGHVLEDSRIEGNDIAGVTANGYGYGTTAGIDGLTVRRTTIAGNNPTGQRLGWHSGGIKATKVRGFVIEDSIVTGNKGDGIWCDIDCTDARIARNRVGDNTFGGIHYEISDLAVIEGNVLWRNGLGRNDGWGWGAAIQVVESRRVVIRDNIAAWNNRGISVLVPNTGRGGQYPVSKPGSYDGIVAEGNTVISTTGYLLFWGDGVNKGGLFVGAKDATARYWSSVNPVGSSGAACVVNLTVAQRDAILQAASIP